MRVLSVLRRAFAALCVLLAAGLVTLSPTLHAQQAVPPLTGHVNDQTGTLTPQQQATMEQGLSAFEARKGSQIALLMVASTAPEAIEAFALRVAEQWKLGRKKVDDGAILVVAKNDRALRIEVGYGLEGALSDIISKRIIEETILPHFKQGDYFGGVKGGLTQMMQVVDGESLPPAAVPAADRLESLRQYGPVLFILALVLGAALRSILGRALGSLVAGLGVMALAWFVVSSVLVAVLAGLAATLLTLRGDGFLARGLGGFYAGGRGVGGFRGGGGGFGGGGASGRW